MLKEWTDTWLQTSRKSKVGNTTSIYDGLTYAAQYAFSLTTWKGFIQPREQVVYKHPSPAQQRPFNVIIDRIRPSLGCLGIALLDNIKYCIDQLVHQNPTCNTLQINNLIDRLGERLSIARVNQSNALSARLIRSTSNIIDKFIYSVTNNVGTNNNELTDIKNLKKCLIELSKIYVKICDLTKPSKYDAFLQTAKDLLIWLNATQVIRLANNDYRHIHKNKDWTDLSNDFTLLDTNIKQLNPNNFGATYPERVKKDANQYLEQLVTDIDENGYDNLKSDTSTIPLIFSKFPLIFCKIYDEIYSQSLDRVPHIDSFEEGLRIAFIIYSCYSAKSECDSSYARCDKETKCNSLLRPTTGARIAIEEHLSKFKEIASDALSFCTQENINLPHAQKFISRIWLFALTFRYIEKQENPEAQKVNHAIFSAYIDLFITNWAHEKRYDPNLGADLFLEVSAFGDKPKRNIIEAPLIFWMNAEYYRPNHEYYAFIEPQNLPTPPCENVLRNFLKTTYELFDWCKAYPAKTCSTTFKVNDSGEIFQQVKVQVKGEKQDQIRYILSDVELKESLLIKSITSDSQIIKETTILKGAAVRDLKTDVVLQEKMHTLVVDENSFDTLEMTPAKFRFVRMLMRVGRRSTSEYAIHDELRRDYHAKDYYCEPIYTHIGMP